MAVSENRSRTIAFRVTEQEFKLLNRLSREHKAHSVSDYARTLTLMPASLKSSIPEIKTQAQAVELRQLIEQQRLDFKELERRMEELEGAVASKPAAPKGE